MIENIFASLPDLFVAQSTKAAGSYYFSLEDIKKTVKLTPERCLVEDGRTVEDADCVCKTSKELFEKQFMQPQKIKSNDPAALQRFLTSFGKSV